MSILTVEQRANLGLYLLTDLGGDGVEETFVEVDGSACVVSETSPGVFVAACTAEIEHFSVYAFVSPVDSDRDGIPDHFGGEVDFCPNTPEIVGDWECTGDVLVRTDESGTASILLGADLVTSSGPATDFSGVAVFVLRDSSGLIVRECLAVGVGLSRVDCPVSGLEVGEYQVEIFAAEAGCVQAYGTASLTVVDSRPPSLVCPSEVVVECLDPTGPTFTGLATAQAYCGDTRTITRTWTAIDTCGGSITCVQIIRVADTTNPTITLNGESEVGLLVGDSYTEKGATVADQCDPDPHPCDWW